MKAKCPRHKRMNRAGRLQAAKYWLPKFEGKSIVSGYSKHFGVTKICAVIELRMLGYEISEEYLEKLIADELQKQSLAEKRKREKEQNFYNSMHPYSDDTFFFISGYTTNGAPYDLTWSLSKSRRP
jgi:hypothetical protein